MAVRVGSDACITTMGVTSGLRSFPFSTLVVEIQQVVPKPECRERAESARTEASSRRPNLSTRAAGRTAARPAAQASSSSCEAASAAA